MTELCTETFGSPYDPAILLIHGAAASMLWWEAELCERLAAHGRYVIRFDNRDTGLSPSCPPGQPDYTLTDLARDAVGVLDQLGVPKAHIVGRSMSGATALVLGVDHPERVASLTFLATTPGGDDLPPMTAEFDEQPSMPVERIVGVLRAYAGDSPYFDEDATRSLAEQDVARTRDIDAAMTNHFLIDFDGPENGGLGDLRMPVLVVHGDNDPVYPLEHGRALQAAVPGSELVVLAGAGHSLPRAAVGRVHRGADPAHVMKSALFLPLFDELAAPRAVADLAAEAEAYGWDGVFVWDHVRWRSPIRAVADPWVTLAAMAYATSRIRLGPMVTPLPRRRPVKVARETATLDQLSNGRLTLGVGIGSDRFGEEWSRTGEEQDERIRGRMLDEALEVLAGAWSGEPVHHRGSSYVVDGVAFEPRPVQRPGVPVWVAGFPGRKAPLRRAARHDGFVPVNLSEPAQVEEIAAEIAALRGGAAAGFDIAVALAPETDPEAYAAAGATWRLVEVEPGATLDTARAILRASAGVR